MPLSENEQRILAEIEKHLQESDPRLAREVGQPSSFLAGVSLRSGIVATLGGLAMMVSTLQIHFLLAFVGFLIMTAGAVAIERSMVERTPGDRRRRRGGIAESLRKARPDRRRDDH